MQQQQPMSRVCFHFVSVPYFITAFQWPPSVNDLTLLLILYVCVCVIDIPRFALFQQVFMCEGDRDETDRGKGYCCFQLKGTKELE